MPALVHTSAPGKALILGEYAVLEGYPAIVQAMDKRAHITINASSGYSLTAPPLANENLAFNFDRDNLFQWEQADTQQHLPFVAPLMQALGDWKSGLDHSVSPWSLTLDTQAFFAGNDLGTGVGQKIGLGSSAALTVALAAAWFQHRHPGQHFDQQRWLPILVQLHRDLQDGRGSGVDIAASLYGGMVEYHTSENNCTARQHSWPDDLECAWIWMGESASTRFFLRQVNDFKVTQKGHYQSLMKALGELAQAGCNALNNQSASDFLDTIKEYGYAMQRLGNAANAPVYTDAHRRLSQLAERHHIAFKPSGAGGGDIAIAASLDTEALTNFCRQVQAAGYGLLELNPAEQGACIHG